MVTHVKSLEDLGVVLETMLIIKNLFFLWHIFWHGIADRKRVLDVMTEFQGFDTFFWTMKMSFLRFKQLETSSYVSLSFFFLFFSHLFFISWRLITLQYCSGFCHTWTWISHGFTCIPHPDPPSHLPLYSIPLGLPSAPGPSTCLMHQTWAGDLFHPR